MLPSSSPAVMHNPDLESRAKAIAIRLISSRDAKNIETLKKFLSFIPSPRCIQNILIAAVLHICEISSETTCWLLQHPELLKPEVDVIAIVTQHLSQQLIVCGLVIEQDFQFSGDGKLLVQSSELNRFIAEIASPSHKVTQAILHSLTENYA